MAVDVTLKFDELKFAIKKNSKSIFLLLACIFAADISYFKLIFDIKISFNIYLFVGINLALIIVWILYNFTHLFSLGIKKTEKFMAVFRFNGNDIKKYDLIRDTFLSKLKSELLNKGIVVKYIDSKGKKDNKEIQKIYNKATSCVVFDIEESTGKIDNVWSYILKVDDVNSKIAAYMPEGMIDSFKRDMHMSIERYYKITDNNSINDIDKHKSLLEMGIMYLAIIVYIVTGKVEDCYSCLQELEKLINSMELSNNTSFKYIKIELNKRYLELYAEVIRMFFGGNSEEEFIKKNIDIFIEDSYKRVMLLKNKAPKKVFEDYLNDYYSTKIMRVYKTKGVKHARIIYEEWYKSDIYKNYYQTLDNAFLLAHEGKYQESIKVYKKCFKTQIIKPSVITEVLTFISNDKYSDTDYPNIFCECIINILAADRSIAYQDLEILKEGAFSLYELIDSELGYMFSNNKR